MILDQHMMIARCAIELLDLTTNDVLFGYLYTSLFTSWILAIYFFVLGT